MPVPIIGPLVDDDAAEGATLLRLRSRLAEELGFSTVTTVTTQASHGEASRVVIADALRDDEVGYGIPARWLYVRTGAQARQSRRIVDDPEAGYQGSQGALVLSRPFDAPLAAGVVVEVTGPLPVRRTGLVAGLVEMTNAGLARIWTEARIELTGTGSDGVSLAPYPWLDRGDAQIVGISDTRGLRTGDAARRAPGRHRVVTDGVDRTLLTPSTYAAHDVYYLDVIVRASRLIFDGGAWAFGDGAGLVDDADQAAPPEDWVLAFSMVKALQELTKMVTTMMGPEQQKLLLADLSERRAIWAAAAAMILRWSMPRPQQRDAEPFVGVAVG